jgi:flavin-binding protein dodecin
MSGHVYKKVEIVGSSPNSMQEAIENGVAKAAETLHNLRWFEVVDTRGQLEEGKVAHWQVTLKIGFTID